MAFEIGDKVETCWPRKFDTWNEGALRRGRVSKVERGQACSTGTLVTAFLDVVIDGHETTVTQAMDAQWFRHDPEQLRAQLAKVTAERNAHERIALNLQREIDVLRRERDAEVAKAEERGARWALHGGWRPHESDTEVAARVCAEARAASLVTNASAAPLVCRLGHVQPPGADVSEGCQAHTGPFVCGAPMRAKGGE